MQIQKQLINQQAAMPMKSILCQLIVLLTISCASGQVFVPLHKFAKDDGAGPGPLIQGADGRLYGTTSEGGTNNGSLLGGVVFGINPDGSGFTCLHQFATIPGVNSGGLPTNWDGVVGAPYGNGEGLIQGTDGILYGACDNGGLYGSGTLFSIKTNGLDFRVLHTFTDTPLRQNVDGAYPHRLLQGSDGELYGTATGGGTNTVGVIFKLDPDGNNFEVIHTIGGSDVPTGGNGPSGGLIQGHDGKLYGATSFGDGGTIFRLNTDGSGFGYLHTNAAVAGSPVRGSDDKIYATTVVGGDHNSGTVFALNTDGNAFSVLHNFGDTNYPNQNGYPRCGLVQASDGKLYGETQGGDVFSLNTNGSEYNVLCTVGNSTAGLIQGNDGALYTSGGYEAYYGAIFKLPATALHITQNRISEVVISWPAWANGYYTLQTNSALSANGWAAASNGIVTVTNNFMLTNTPTGNAEFFRLH